MAVGHQRLAAGFGHQLLVATPVPERQRPNAHKRTVAVVALAGRASHRRGRAVCQRLESVLGLDAHVEENAVHSQVAFAVPGQQAKAEIVQV
jgi:hypothetical protein